MWCPPLSPGDARLGRFRRSRGQPAPTRILVRWYAISAPAAAGRSTVAPGPRVTGSGAHRVESRETDDGVRAVSAVCPATDRWAQIARPAMVKRAWEELGHTRGW
jgi:hypothetical protein